MMRAIVEGDKSGLAGMIQYPLFRPYPLQNIEDSAAMVAYFDILFDDSLRRVLGRTKVSDWERIGWRGFTFSHGEYLWFDEGVLNVNYDSERERAMIACLERWELESLHPSMQPDSEVGFVIVPENEYSAIRVDYLLNVPCDTDDIINCRKIRVAFYKGEIQKGVLPAVIYEGKLWYEGSGNYMNGEFGDSEKRYSISEFCDDDHSSRDIYSIRLQGEEGSEEVICCKSGKWQDFLENECEWGITE